MTRMPAALAAGAAACLMAACSSPESGNANTPRSSTSMTSTPAKAQPLQKVSNKPCAAISDSTYRAILSDTVRDRTSTKSRHGPMCVLQPESLDGPTVSVDVYENITSPRDLVSSGGNFPYHEPASPVAGFNALHTAITSDGPQTGECKTTVVASGTPAIGVDINRHGKADPDHPNMCAMSDQLARAVIADAKGPG